VIFMAFVVMMMIEIVIEMALGALEAVDTEIDLYRAALPSFGLLHATTQRHDFGPQVKWTVGTGRTSGVHSLSGGCSC